MDFERRLRSYLEGLPQIAPPLGRIDHDALYRHLLERLRELEASGARASTLEDLHRDWTPDQIAKLARYLEGVSSSGGSGDPHETQRFAMRALDAAIGCLGPGAGLVDHLELGRILEAFGSSPTHQYAAETRLVRAQPMRGAQLTNLGRTFLGLRGRDAVRWLLTVEVSQSGGRWDPWRTPRLLLQQALDGIDKVVVDGDHDFEFAAQTFERLTDLSVLSAARVTPDLEIRRYEVPEGMHELVHAVLETGPWHAAVAALLDDETSTALQSRAPSTAAASGQLTKLITHEVRNALVPVRHHIDALRAISTDTGIVERIDKARRGVIRVLEFIDDLVAANDLFSEPYASCDVFELIRQAIRLADGGERVELVSGAPARVHAPRSRLVRALNNILLNALHATASGGHVRASFRVADDVVEILIDDGGPGVPVELRTTVFDEGYTTRGGPGHGFGLAFVRGVVEAALQGRVWCDASPLGGARFVLAIPQDKKS